MHRRETMRYALCLVAVLLALTLACGQAKPAPSGSPGVTPAPPAPAPATPPSLPERSAFVIAIEYGVPGLAAAYAPTGVTYTKPMPAFGVWGNVEPEPGKVNWAPIDAVVTEYQRAGFTGVQLLITAESPWAATRPPSLGDKGDSFPKEEYLDEYAEFVRSFVERYDGDGIDDAPGLLYPIHHWGVEREYTGYWPSGDAADYLRLLRIAYPVIKEADPQAEVLLVALLMMDIFDGAPAPEEVERRLRKPNILNYSREHIQTALTACDAYDVVDFHSLGDYTEIPPTVAWIRQELEHNGCGEHPIWIGDAFSMSGLVGYGFGPVPPRAFAPASEEIKEEVLALLASVADPAAENHDEATGWLRGEMARGLVKKIVVAAGEVLAGINIGNLEDWDTGVLPQLNVLLTRSAGTPVYMGMMDRRITNRHAGGPLPGFAAPISKVREPGDPRPAFYALELVVAKMGSHSSVAKLDLGVAGVWGYRFETPGGPLWVLWHDDGRLHLPGDAPPATEIALEMGAGRALLTRTPLTAEPAGSETVETDAEVLHLTLDSTPTFVEATG